MESFGLPRIVTSKSNLERLVSLVDSPYNGLTLCTGSLGSNQKQHSRHDKIFWKNGKNSFCPYKKH